MAISLIKEYPEQVDAASVEYPHGRARNVTSRDDISATPLDERWMNDHFGFQQALLAEAGIVPSGEPDRVGASDYLDAINSLIQVGEVSDTQVTVTANGTGAVPRTQRSKNSDFINIMDFYDRTDGDFTTAVLNAFNAYPEKAGFTINFPSGRFFIKKPLYSARAIVLDGDGIGNTILDFSQATEKVPAPYDCMIVIAHHWNIATPTSTVLNPIVMPEGSVVTSGTNSKIKNMTIKGAGKDVLLNGSKTHGIFINAPSNLERVEVTGFSGHPYFLSANVNPAGYGGIYSYSGVANHTEFSYCQAYNNGSNGIHILGSDANTFVIKQCLFAVNDGWAIFDHSLLGGTVIGCESDSNGKGSYAGSGYDGTAATPSRTQWIGNYSEGGTNPVHYAVNSRNMIIGYTGGGPADGQPYFGSIADRGFIAQQDINVASDDVSAYDIGGTTDRATRISRGAIRLRTTVGSDLLQVGSFDSSNYASISLGNIAVMTVPLSDIVDLIKKGVPWFSNGITLSQTCHVTAANAVPTTGFHQKGEYVYNSAPTEGAYSQWVCTESGSPGVWMGVGKIEAIVPAV